MVAKSAMDRLASLEAFAGAVQHVGVIAYREGDDVGALIAATHVAPAYGHIVVPADLDEASWQAAACAYFNSS